MINSLNVVIINYKYIYNFTINGLNVVIINYKYIYNSNYKWFKFSYN